jgi:hypothetical protein
LIDAIVAELPDAAITQFLDPDANVIGSRLRDIDRVGDEITCRIAFENRALTATIARVKGDTV